MRHRALPLADLLEIGIARLRAEQSRLGPPHRIEKCRHGLSRRRSRHALDFAARIPTALFVVSSAGQVSGEASAHCRQSCGDRPRHAHLLDEISTIH